ncbi:hypothetical protein OU995_18535 [Roseateles sp. SL47]|uniref:hypothetical protein n=1 Tax=Roseateles sp. SL47 TaxID=2995138 RepID=UPI00226DEBE9|nr:hypothetical protein [Roseateles sp. SL47]WAC71569.1 hypothetical protein OU995_18535 [Roseateles sp. SL47]
MLPRLITRLFGARPAPGLRAARSGERAKNDSRFTPRESRFTMYDTRFAVSESRLDAVLGPGRTSFDSGFAESHFGRLDPHALNGPVPPLDIRGLLSIEDRADTASPHRLHAWIREISDQIPHMELADRGYAADLVLKLRHLLDHHAAFGRV